MRKLSSRPNLKSHNNVWRRKTHGALSHHGIEGNAVYAIRKIFAYGAMKVQFLLSHTASWVLVREIVTVVVAISLSQMSRVRYAIRCQRIPRLYSYHILNLRTVVQSVIQGVYLENHRTQTSMTLVLSVKLVITNKEGLYS